MRISDWSSDVCSSDLGADDLSLLAQLVNDPRAAIASTAGIVDGRHLGVQSLVGQRVGTGRAHAPLAVAAARHLQNAAKPTDGVLVAMLVDPGVLHRDTLAKYDVAFRMTSTSSFASSSSLRTRPFHTPTFTKGPRTG